MPFFKELRRRSRANFHTSDSSTDSSATVPTQKSSSTLNSSVDSSTPPSSNAADSSSATLPTVKASAESPMSPLPTRPAMSASNRNSMITMSPSASTMRIPGPTSLYAPRVLSVQNESVVHQKIVLITGEIGEARSKPLDGSITVHHDRDGQAFPPTNWPVSDSYFKTLVYLSPGWNRLRFDFTSPKLSGGSNGPSHSGHSSYLLLNYLPLNSAPPLQLAIIVASDSSETYDATPGRVKAEGNDLSMAIRKFRMAAQLWQTFTAEQMFRQKLGRRCFRFEEEWQVGTLSMRDWENGTMKNETRVHVIRCKETVAELRASTTSTSCDSSNAENGLLSIASRAVKQHFNIKGPAQKQHVAALVLDAHWNKDAKVVQGHTAAGWSNDQELSLAIFGSHTLQSYPSCVEEVVPAFMDCTKTDSEYVTIDGGLAGSSWEAANRGIGAHMHQVGHLFGGVHQDQGVMASDYTHLNRTFCVREAYSTRTKAQGLRLCKTEQESGWHRLDALRFRHHPCFRSPMDEPLPADDSLQIFPVGNDKLIFLAASGISFIKVFTEGDEFCRSWFEYLNPDPRNGILPKQVILTDADIRAKLSEDKKKAKVRLQAFAGSSQSLSTGDISELFSKAYIVSLPALRSAPKKNEGLTMNTINNVLNIGKALDNRQGFKGRKLGVSSTKGSTSQEVILDSIIYQSKLLTSVRIFHGSALDGLEFCYEDGQSQIFGKQNDSAGSDEFYLDTRRGETVLGFNVRAGDWVDGIEILTSTGRRSGMFGSPQGGHGYTLMPPRGYSLAGVAGSSGSSIDSFQIIITR